MALTADQIKRMQGVPERLAEYEAKPRIEDQDTFFRELTSHYPPCSPKELQDKALRHNGVIRCRQTAPDKPQTVALIGDSHAEHLFPGLAKNGFPRENLVYFSYPCLPFWGLSGHRDCADVTAVLDYVANQSTIHTVVLANLWEARSEDTNNRLVANPAATDEDRIYKSALAITLEKFTAAGKKVVFAFDVPHLGFLPESCQSRPITLQKTARTPCAVTRAEEDARQRKYRQLTLEVLRDFPAVKAWDPMDFLCDERWCRAAEGERSLYRDEHHLSSYASYELGAHFAPKGIAGPSLTTYR